MDPLHMREPPMPNKSLPHLTRRLLQSFFASSKLKHGRSTPKIKSFLTLLRFSELQLSSKGLLTFANKFQSNITPSHAKPKLSYIFSSCFLCPSIAILILLSSPSSTFSETLKIASIPRDSKSFVPLFPRNEIDPSVIVNAFEPLIDYDTAGQIVPRLASHWSFSEDLRTLELHLRENVYFHNGAALTSSHISNILRSLNPPLASNIKAIDAKTLSLEFSDPFPGIVDKLTNVFISHPDLEHPFGAVGTGPFRITSLNDLGDVYLEQYSDYWGEKPSWDQLHFLKVSNEDSPTSLLLEGKVDILPITDWHARQQLLNTKDITVYQTLTGATYFLGSKNNVTNGQPHSAIGRLLLAPSITH